METEDIKNSLMQEVLKREVVEGEKAEEAQKKIQRALRKQQRTVQSRTAAKELKQEEAEEEVSSANELLTATAAEKETDEQ